MTKYADRYEIIQENKKEIKKIFLERVKKGAKCWHWKVAITSEDQGQIGLSIGTIKAHRLSYMLYVGHLKPRTVLRQTCNNKLCVNPKHQKVVINKELLKKKLPPRDIKGAKNFNAKLKEKDIKKIRKMEGKMSYNAIGRKFGITGAHVTRILRKECWGHVK